MAVYKIKWDEGSSRGGAQSGLPRSHRKGSLNLSMVDTIWREYFLMRPSCAGGFSEACVSICSYSEITYGERSDER